MRKLVKITIFVLMAVLVAGGSVGYWYWGQIAQQSGQLPLLTEKNFQSEIDTAMEDDTIIHIVIGSASQLRMQSANRSTAGNVKSYAVNMDKSPQLTTYLLELAQLPRVSFPAHIVLSSTMQRPLTVVGLLSKREVNDLMVKAGAAAKDSISPLTEEALMGILQAMSDGTETSPAYILISTGDLLEMELSELNKLSKSRPEVRLYYIDATQDMQLAVGLLSMMGVMPPSFPAHVVIVSAEAKPLAIPGLLNAQQISLLIDMALNPPEAATSAGEAQSSSTITSTAAITPTMPLTPTVKQ